MTVLRSALSTTSSATVSDHQPHTWCLKKVGSLFMFDNNFGKCGPIFKVLSPIN